MKRLMGLAGIIIALFLLTGCGLFGERRYGEGDVIRVLINHSLDQTSQFFLNMRIYNDSDEQLQVSIIGFEYLENNEWISISPIANEDWMFEKTILQPSGHESSSVATIMSFDKWLNPNYPTIGDFRAIVRVYNMNGDFQFEQPSNIRELQYFRFEN